MESGEMAIVFPDGKDASPGRMNRGALPDADGRCFRGTPTSNHDPSGSTRPGRVAIVEDEVLVARDIELTLRGHSYEVVGIARSVKEAESLLDSKETDIILMDITLGDGPDGIEFAGTVKERWGLPHVFLTAHADGDTLQRAKLTQPYGYLSKPFEEAELVSTLETVLYKRFMERRLEESERWLAGVLGSIESGIVALDCGGKVRFANPSAETLFGVDEGGLVGAAICEIIKVYSSSGDEIAIDRNPDRWHELRWVSFGSPDNPCDWLLSYGPILDASNRKRGLLLVLRNDESKRIAEERLALFSSAMGASTDGIAVTDSGGAIMECNASMAYLLGGDSPVELRGERLSDRIVGIHAAAGEFVRENGQHAFDAEIRRPDGHATFLELTTADIGGVIGREKAQVIVGRDVTRKREMMRELEVARRKYNLIFELANPAIFVLDHEGRIEMSNASSERILGYGAESFHGRAISNFETESSIPDIIMRHASMCPDRGCAGHESRMVCADGRLIDASFRLSEMPEEGDGANRWLVVLDDISEEKRMSERSAREKQRIERIFESIPAGVILVDRETRRVANVNGHAARMFGCPKEEVIGETCHKKVCPRELGECPIIDHGLPIDNSERTILDCTGMAIPVIKSVTSIDLDGREHLLECFLDITDLKTAEAALKESEERLAKMASAAMDAIIMMDSSGRVSLWNKAAELMFGYTAGEAMELSVHSLLSPYRGEGTHEDRIERFLRSGEGDIIGRIIELEARRRDGTTFPTELSVASVETSSGWNTVVIIRDRTVARQRQAETERLMAAIEEKNRELDDYTHMVSHDLKAPLVTIQGFATLLRRKHSSSLPPEAERYVAAMQQGADEMASLVNDLLVLSRSGRAAIRMERVDPGAVALSCWSAMESQVLEAKAELQMAGDLPTLVYDATHMRQVLSNLLGNALKYSAPGRAPVVDVGWEDGPSEITIWVRDNGIGIAEQNLERIFLPFERISNDNRGSGIGLAIVRKIAGRHGGRAWAESVPGVGSTFRFTVPKPGGLN